MANMIYSMMLGTKRTNNNLTAQEGRPKNSAIPPHTPEIYRSYEDFVNLPLIVSPPLLVTTSLLLKYRS